MLKQLYHGSRFKNEELKPTYLITGNLVKWDATESNRYLYAGTDKTLAIMMAAAAECEKHNAVEIHTTDKSFTAVWEGFKPRSVLHHLVVYLYTIAVDPKDNWVKVNNKNNPDVDEYKTKSIIPNDRFTVETVRFIDWIKKENITLTLTTKPRENKSLEW